ncbi:MULTISPECIES: hypothetical protein [Nocardia]|uniref:hypothetical protein n=1 Tax=Nocardia TaxID=1817 RepID=UPI000313FFED|nr:MULTISPECIES: hypothetical protein [Nocardia]
MSTTTPGSGQPSMTRHHARQRDRGTPIENLLEARELHLAVAGRHVEGPSPLTRWARELADIHASLLSAAVSPQRRPADYDDIATRDQMNAVMAAIDEWAIFHLPRPVNADHHTHPLGEVISHYAEVFARSQWILRHTTNTEHHHDAALRMAQTHRGYADLVTAIRTRRVQLPLGWRAIQELR